MNLYGNDVTENAFCLRLILKTKGFLACSKISNLLNYMRAHFPKKAKVVSLVIDKL